MQQAGCFTIDAGHPSLPGHFPGRPIVPGVVLLDEAFACLRPYLPGRLELATAKFTTPVLPGEAVDVAWDAASGQTLFTCSVAGRIVLRGTLRVWS
jgi:3-hydroxymyristoyl/3-hydroxydecanoyl-(acyl carrier protein) dehydratase